MGRGLYLPLQHLADALIQIDLQKCFLQCGGHFGSFLLANDLQISKVTGIPLMDSSINVHWDSGQEIGSAMPGLPHLFWLHVCRVKTPTFSPGLQAPLKVLEQYYSTHILM